jgi:hypothetical protein
LRRFPQLSNQQSRRLFATTSIVAKLLKHAWV